MDATQAISDSILESDEEGNDENQNDRGQSPAKLCILENEHIPKTEIPLYLGDNVLGRDHSCSSVHLPAPSVSKQHATISIIVHGKQKLSIEALIWDLGSLNGTRKGRLKLTPHVRYAISEGESLVIADIPCQFVICNDVFKSLQRNAKNSESQSLERRAHLSGPPLRKEGSASQDCVSESSSTVFFENMKNTPVGNRCLSLEKTPNQPQEILVPESDSDSEGESRLPLDTRRRALVSDSDSHLSSPNSATFLSPANKIVPESEDEMSTTPASANVNGSGRGVRFGRDNSDVGQQQLKNQLEIADDNEEEEATPDKSALKENSKNVEEMKDDITDIGQKELSADSEGMKAGVEIPEFNMDSDTDVEEEEEGVPSAVPVVSPEIPNQTNTDSYHLDSDTDVENSVDDVSPSVPLSDEKKPPETAVLPQPAGFSLDSDTDVDDEAPESAAKAEAVSAGVAESAASTQPKDFHLDSDTDVDDEEDKKCESGVSVPQGLHMNSDTDEEVSHDPSAAGSDMRPVALSPGSDSFDDEDFVVAETQSFVLPGKVCPRRLPNDISSEPTQAFVLESSVEENDTHLSGDVESFKLGLSESSHLRNQALALALESTQPFGAADGSRKGNRLRRAKKDNMDVHVAETQPSRTHEDDNSEDEVMPRTDHSSAADGKLEEESNIESHGSSTSSRPSRRKNTSQNEMGEEERPGPSSRSRRVTRAKLSEEAESSGSSTMDAKECKTLRSRRAKLSSVETEDEKPETAQVRQSKRKKNSKRLQAEEEEEMEDMNTDKEKSPEQDSLQAELAERSRLEELERERAEKEKLEQELIRAQKLERERVEKERQEELRRELAEKERARLEKMEEERLEKERQEKLEQERLQAEQAEKERLRLEKLEEERIEKERQEKLQQELAEKERLEKAHLEQLKIEKERKEKLDQERLQAEQSVKPKENKNADSGPQTPVSQTSRKRQAPVKSSPVAKTPRRSAASPAGSRLGPSYKVLYTGVVDEAGEKVLTRLGGSMAKGVADMNCLVTDKVRRTVKFLCAVAKGIPVVTTNWLERSGKAGSFLSPSAFIVKDPEQEKKFNFSLEESLRVASNQPLLQGFEIHITKSVKPEPVYMKDILSCSGATFLPKMPSSHKPHTIVISCEDDCQLCAPAFSASIPVVSAEFILSGILQQKVDLETHKLCAPAASLPTAGGRGKARKKS
ncbi:mediator of DNA damage checkpoint protein 1 [Neosynchiropus ocellatus]